MSTLTGKTVATTYRDLLQISNQNVGIDGDFRYIEDGEGTISVLGLSTSGIQVNGHVQPALTEVYDLGNSSKRFRDLYLSGNTIYLGDNTITSDDIQAVKDIQTTSIPVSSVVTLASTSVQPGDSINFNVLSNRPTTLIGYGITDAATVADMLVIDSTLDPLNSTVNSASANWSDTHTTVSNNSGDWFSPPALTNLLQTSSGTWNTATQPDTDVQFDNLTVTGQINGPATMTIDPAAVGDNTGRVVIAGDLQVDGVTTTVNSTTMTVSGKTITLAEGATEPAMADQAGIHVDHVDANILYDATSAQWNINHDLKVTGVVNATADIRVNDDSVVTQSDVGTNPNQIPLNKDLGSLAYQDVITTDMVESRAIAAEISDSAMDVFVYDTSRDSDGGAWRKRTQHTSWYNETLNTATRGARREFPAVAVIVAESGNVKKLKIYDGDDPDLPLWMSFEASGLGSALGRSSSTIFGISSICMLNGLLCVTGLGSSNNIETLCQISFIDDVFWQWHTYGFGGAGIIERNETHSIASQEYRGRTDEPISVHSYHDVAMTVLPNALIDDDTGLPVPTIAVATDGGVSVIKDDGTVVDIINSVYDATHVVFDDDNKLLVCAHSNGVDEWHSPSIYEIPSSDIDFDDHLIRINPYHASTHNDTKRLGALSDLTTELTSRTSGNTHGVTNFDPNYSEREKTLSNFITSKYNTGWMCGDTKLATLSDSIVETVGQSIVDVMPNGTFESNIDGWTSDPSSTHVTLSQATVSTTSTGSKAMLAQKIGDSYTYAARYSNLLTPGNRYRITGRVNADWTTAYKFRIRAGGSNVTWSTTNGLVQDDWVTFDTGWIVADGPHLEIGSESHGGGGIDNFYIDDVVVSHDSTEKIINGVFDQTNGYTPLGTSGWNAATGATITVSNESLKLETGSTGDSLWAYQTIPGLAAGDYMLVVDIINNTAQRAIVRVGTTGANSNDLHNSAIISDSTSQYTVSFTVTETGPVTVTLMYDAQGSTIYFDNVSVRPAEADRSANDNGLQIFGEIDKTPVAPGADLVAYSGFNANNYLMQPYNAGLDFGTGDFCVMGWFKNANSNALLCTRLLPQAYDTSGTDRGFLISFGSDGALSFATYTQGFRVTGRKNIGTQNDMSGIDGWTHFVAVRDGGVMRLYINAIKETSEVANSDDISDNTTSIPLSIGCFNEISSNIFTGSTALIRISATAPTAKQIAKIYRDEKVLFQDGAQATLYGTSDAVTALAHDDTTDLLHVGTSAGRSVFSGLRRTSNTDQPVTTTISTSNDFTVEQ